MSRTKSPLSKRKRLTIRVTEAQLDALRKGAKRRGRPMATLILEIALANLANGADADKN